MDVRAGGAGLRRMHGEQWKASAKLWSFAGNEILRKASAYLRWRSLTLGRSDDRLHRRLPRRAWGLNLSGVNVITRIIYHDEWDSG